MRQAVRMNGASPLRDCCMIPLRDEGLSTKAGGFPFPVNGLTPVLPLQQSLELLLDSRL